MPGAAQKLVARLVCEEHCNVFFTGNAGTGASCAPRRPSTCSFSQTVLELCSTTDEIASLCHSTGKSFLLNHIIAKLRLIYGDDFSNCVAVTAATGIAATHISGVAISLQPLSLVLRIDRRSARIEK